MKIGGINKTILSAIVLTVLVSILFYRSAWGGLVFPIILYLLYQEERKSESERRSHAMEEQFLNGIRVLNTSLKAGLSMENAWREVERETELLYGNTAIFYKEVKEINASVSMNVPIEKLVQEAAYRSGVEDMIYFGELFVYGKRCGTNWTQIINTTTLHLCEKYEVRKEIEVMIAEKKMEQRVMNVIPLVLLGVMQIFAWDYMCVLYHNVVGVICMTIALFGYVVAIILSQRILQIKV